MGETIPPRTPDRNFNGFFSGISPWLLWLAMGVSVGNAADRLLRHLTELVRRPQSGGGCRIARPRHSLYLDGLMLAFLHDHPMAANPWNIAVAMFRLKGSSILLSLFVVLALALIAGGFAGPVFLRPNHYRIYLHLGLVSWMVMQWTSIVVMRVLGTYYFHHRTTLRWHRESPRWGVAWRL